MGASVLVPLALSAASAGAGYYNNQQTLRKQQDAATAGLITQQHLQDQANSRVNNQVTQLGASNPNASRDQANAQFVAALQRSRASANQSTPAVAGANARYGQAVNAGQASNAASEGTQADLMSRIEAPQLQRQSEDVGIQDLGTALSQIAGQSQGQNFLTELRVKSAQNNPWLTLLQGGLGGAASGVASRVSNPDQKIVGGAGGTYSDGTPVPADAWKTMGMRGY